MSIHPYQNLPKKSFWSSAVAGCVTLVPEALYEKKWTIGKSEKIATAGSCFAQHIGRHMRKSGFQVLDMEPPPPLLAPEQQGRFGYSIYSARYGNIYTIRQLLQLAKEAFDEWTPGEVIWRDEKGSCYDALRPGIEPEGLGSENEVMVHREFHLQRVREMFETMDLFIFTLGLTEAWIHKQSGTVFPTAPGTIAGSHDPEKYEFKNFRFQEIIGDFEAFRSLILARRKNDNPLRILLTVSPVPLTATASGEHVLLATTYSKSVLRGVAGQVAMEYSDVDYFPSYEIITNPWSKTSFYEENMRSVTNVGVTEVMRTFFDAHQAGDDSASDVEPHRPPPQSPALATEAESPADDVICEEALLEAFGKPR